MTDTQNTQHNSGPQPIETTADAAASPNSQARAVDELVAAIRAAVMPGAAPEARAAGATACRAIQAALEALPGQPLVTRPQPAASPVSPIAAALPQLGALLPQLATLPRDQLRDLFATLIRTVLPARTTVPTARPGTATTAAPRYPAASTALVVKK